MVMQVIKTSFESTIHNVCAELVHEEISGLQRFSIGAVVTAPVYALTARVIAVAAHALWIANEVVQFVPRMIGITIGLATCDQAALSRHFFQRAARVYGLYFQTLGAQFAVGSLACVIPEFSHYLLELHKPLFALQVETFIQSLPDLPHVQKEIRKSYGPVDSLVQLYQRLGLTNNEWRQALTTAILSSYRDNPKLGPDYLTTDSKLFQEAFTNTLFFYAALKLNEKQERQQLTVDIVNGLHPDIWRHMKDYLEIGTQIKLIELLKETIVDHEVNNHFLYLFKVLTGFTYREPATVAVLRMLPEKMTESRTKLIQDQKFSQEDIESYMSLSPMTLDGIVRLIDSSRLSNANPPAITFSHAGHDVTFTQDFQFFGAKPMLVELKTAHARLTAEEKATLYQLCCDTDGVQPTARTREFFQMLQLAKMELFDKKMNNTDLDGDSTVDWSAPFTF